VDDVDAGVVYDPVNPAETTRCMPDQRSQILVAPDMARDTGHSYSQLTEPGYLCRVAITMFAPSSWHRSAMAVPSPADPPAPSAAPVLSERCHRFTGWGYG